MAELETYKGYYLWRYVPLLAAAVNSSFSF